MPGNPHIGQVDWTIPRAAPATPLKRATRAAADTTPVRGPLSRTRAVVQFMRPWLDQVLEMRRMSHRPGASTPMQHEGAKGNSLPQAMMLVVRTSHFRN